MLNRAIGSQSVPLSKGVSVPFICTDFGFTQERIRPEEG